MGCRGAPGCLRRTRPPPASQFAAVSSPRLQSRGRWPRGPSTHHAAARAGVAGQHAPHCPCHQNALDLPWAELRAAAICPTKPPPSPFRSVGAPCPPARQEHPVRVKKVGGGTAGLHPAGILGAQAAPVARGGRGLAVSRAVSVGPVRTRSGADCGAQSLRGTRGKLDNTAVLRDPVFQHEKGTGKLQHSQALGAAGGVCRWGGAAASGVHPLDAMDGRPVV